MVSMKQTLNKGKRMYMGTALILVLQLLATPSELIDRECEPGRSGAIEEICARLPLYFIENRGQIDSPDVAFVVRGADRSLYFTGDGITLALADRTSGETRRWVVKLDFVEASPDAGPLGEEKTDAVFSFFKGRPEEWKAGLPAYRGIAYRNLWPGIDLVYSGTVNGLKYEFRLQPGADPERIRLRYRGIDGLTVNKTGDLAITARAGSFEDGKPLASQLIDGQHREVAVDYVVEGCGGENGFSYGFQLGEYDAGQPLIIDPSFLVYCGYIGGSGDDSGLGIALDLAGNAYVTGTTGSDESTFPLAAGPDLSFNGKKDVFVAKVKADGSELVYCGYIGGSGSDSGWSIAVDALGSAVVAGSTDSDETTFPVLLGPDLTFNGGVDAFVARVAADGTSLDYCGYIGGSGSDMAYGMSLDDQSNVYLAGITDSDETTFPVRVGPDLTFNGEKDAFVARVKANGSSLECCGYIGGEYVDVCYGIVVDSLGHAHVAGSTLSDETTFPVLVGPDLTFNDTGLGFDAFVAKVEIDGTGLIYCGYIGGGQYDEAPGIALDSLGHAYVAGFTASDEGSFPVLVGPDLTFNGGGYYLYDAFVAKVEPDGSGLVYCGYIGGSNDEIAGVIAVDQEGNAYLAGSTESAEDSFPSRVGPGLRFGGGMDAFVTRVSASGTEIDYCGYVGGADDDFCRGLALDGEGNVFLTGGTRSDETTFPVVQGPDLTFNGTGGGATGGDAFTAHVPARHILLRAGNVDTGSGDPVDILFVNDSAGDDAYRTVVNPSGSTITIAVTNPPGGPLPAAFALYAWPGEAGPLDPALQPYDVGTACFPMPLSNGVPWGPPTTLVNNTGLALLGFPMLPAVPPAPAYVVQGYTALPGTWTIQGIIYDNGSGGAAASLTNAVVLIQQ